MNKKFKYIGIIISMLFIIWQSYDIFVDVYNFKQLEKVKVILEHLKRNDKQFLYLKDFNEHYNVNIKPINNCYYLRNYKGENRVPYTFGFKLESFVYKYIYGTKYYAYPKYDIPYMSMCVSGRGCYDASRDNFEYIISHPCEEN